MILVDSTPAVGRVGAKALREQAALYRMAAERAAAALPEEGDTRTQAVRIAKTLRTAAQIEGLADALDAAPEQTHEVTLDEVRTVMVPGQTSITDELVEADDHAPDARAEETLASLQAAEGATP